MMRTIWRGLLLTSMLGASWGASAGSLEFISGSLLSGSLTYDPSAGSTGIIEAWDLVSTSTSSFPGIAYTPGFGATNPGPIQFVFTADNGSMALIAP